MIYRLRDRENYDILGHVREYQSALNANCISLLSSPIISNSENWIHISDHRYKDPTNQWEIYSDISSYLVQAEDGVLNAFAFTREFGISSQQRYLPPYNGWVAWRNLKRKVCIRKYQLGNGGESGYTMRSIQDFQLEGSNDGENWEIIDSRTNVFGSSYPPYMSFVYYEIKNNKSFYYHRINIIKTYQNSNNVSRIADILAYS